MRHLLDLMEYLERHSLDPRLYWLIPEDSSAGNPALELKYQQQDDRGWYYKFKSQEVWLFCDREDLVRQLHWHQVDLMQLIKQIEQSITQQIVYTRMIYREASELLGPERLESAIKTHEQFLEELSVAIRGMLGEGSPDDKPMLRLVYDESRILN